MSLLPAATDIVAALGAVGQLVGRTHECDWPPAALDAVPVVTATSLAEGLTSREISAALSGDHRGSSIYQLDHEALAALKPDLILTQDLCQQCAVSYRTVNDAVSVMELDTIVMSLQPHTIDGILQATATVAEVIGAGRRAQQIAADSAARLAALPGPKADGPRVLFVEWLDPLMPGGHWVPEQITHAGGRWMLIGPGQHSTPQQWDDVIALDPELIVFGPCGFTPHQTRSELERLVPAAAWGRLSAVRNGHCWIVDGPAYFNRPGPRVIDGAEILTSIVTGNTQPKGGMRFSPSSG